MFCFVLIFEVESGEILFDKSGNHLHGARRHMYEIDKHELSPKITQIQNLLLAFLRIFRVFSRDQSIDKLCHVSFGHR